jgi:hypothetical protein
MNGLPVIPNVLLCAGVAGVDSWHRDPFGRVLHYIDKYSVQTVAPTSNVHSDLRAIVGFGD